MQAWVDSGAPIDHGSIDLRPVRVLYDLDGPRIFTCLDSFDETWLAYQCDEDEDSCVLLLVPFNSDLENSLTHGSMTVLEALHQPRLWVARTGLDLTITSLRKSRIEQVPHELLPHSEAMLWPHLQPLLNLRGVGKEAKRVVASVIRDTIQAAADVLKDLLESVSGIAENIKLRPLYDLPAQRLAFNSFEVSFRAPTADELRQQGIDNTELDRIYMEVGQLLRRGAVAAAATELPESKDDDHLMGVALRAIERLSPSGRGPLQEIYLSGQILGPAERPFRLSKQTRQNARKGVRMLTGTALENSLVQNEGVVRAFDRDKLSVRIHATDGEDIVLEIEDLGSDLVDKAIEALQGEYEVLVSGERKADSGRVVLQSLHRKDL